VKGRLEHGGSGACGVYRFRIPFADVDKAVAHTTVCDGATFLSEVKSRADGRPGVTFKVSAIAQEGAKGECTIDVDPGTVTYAYPVCPLLGGIVTTTLTANDVQLLGFLVPPS
jgi:hypothetical protein